MLTLFEGQRSRMVARYFRSYALVKNTLYWLGSDLGEGFGAGFAFFAGLDTPKLMSKKPNPLRRDWRMLIAQAFRVIVSGERG